MWLAVVNVGLFLFFPMSYLAPRGRVEWRSMGMVTVFLVVLFTEMYGFPLTIYLLTGQLGVAYPALEPFGHKYGHLWVVVLGESNWAWAVVMVISLVLQVSGYLLLSKGWRLVHGAHGGMVTNGVYAYARHPQYTGLMLVILGFLVQWPTLITLLMAPVLIGAYIRLARTEEWAQLARFGEAYAAYAANTPMFYSPFGHWGVFLGVEPRRGTGKPSGASGTFQLPAQGHKA